MMVVQPASRERISELATPRMIPITPPLRERVRASTRNCMRIAQVLAPTAMRMPISRVRSVTETSMIFMIPMPPTRRETEAMAPSSSDMTRVDCSAAWSIWVRLRIVKSNSPFGLIRCRCLRSSVICRSARSMSAAEPALMRMERTEPTK